VIDGLLFDWYSNGGTFEFALSSTGDGYAFGSNPEGQSAYVSLIGYVPPAPFCPAGCGGSFVVLPTQTPEPGSLAFGLLGLGAIALRIANKHIRSGSSGAIGSVGVARDAEPG
jgi:hypothetical protein